MNISIRDNLKGARKQLAHIPGGMERLEKKVLSRVYNALRKSAIEEAARYTADPAAMKKAAKKARNQPYEIAMKAESGSIALSKSEIQGGSHGETLHATVVKGAGGPIRRAFTTTVGGQRKDGSLYSHIGVFERENANSATLGRIAQIHKNRSGRRTSGKRSDNYPIKQLYAVPPAEMLSGNEAALRVLERGREVAEQDIGTLVQKVLKEAEKK